MTDDQDIAADGGTERRHTLNESHDKVRLKTQVKRGEGTRDQDTHDIKIRAETPTEAAEAMSDAIAELEARDVFDRVRALQPDDDEEE